MPKIQLKDFSGGLNTRLDNRLINDNQSQISTDTDTTSASLKGAKGTDTNSAPQGDYQIRSTWVTDADAKTFTESGDTVIKSYETKTPEFQSINSSGALTTSKEAGVPSTPTALQIEKLNQGSASPSSSALLYHSVRTNTLKTKTVADDTYSGNPQTRITDNGQAEGVYRDSQGGYAFFENGVLARYNASYSQTLSNTTISHHDKAWFFSGDYFVGVSYSGITKANLTSGVVTNHPISNPSWPTWSSAVQNSGTTTNRDGYETGNVPLIDSGSSYISAYATANDVYVSVQYRGGRWKTNHVQKHPDQDSSFITYHSNSSTKYEIEGGYYYVGIIMDPASVHRYQSSHPLGSGHSSFIADRTNTISSLLTGLADDLHWGTATVGSTHASGATILAPQINYSYGSGMIPTSYDQDNFSTPAKGLFHGPHSCSASATAGHIPGATSNAGESADAPQNWQGGIFYVPINTSIKIGIAQFPMYLWKCGTIGRSVPTTKYSEASDHGGDWCYSINNTSNNCTDFYVRTMLRHQAGYVNSTTPLSSTATGNLQLRVFHDMSEGTGLKWISNQNTENVKFASTSDAWYFFQKDPDLSSASNADWRYTGAGSNSSGNQGRDEIVIHKLPLNATNNTATTISSYETLPKYVMGSDAQNWVSTPWHEIHNIRSSTYYNFGGALTGQYGSTTWTWSGFASAFPINRVANKKVDFQDQKKDKSKSTNTPFFYEDRWPVRSSTGYPVYPSGTDQFNPNSWLHHEHFVGVANTSSFANRLFESANKIQVNSSTKMYPTTTGVILQGSNSTTTYSGTNIITRPLNHSSFHTTITYSLTAQSSYTSSNVKVLDDKVAFYGGTNLDIFQGNSNTTYTQSSFGITGSINSFNLIGNLSTGFIAYSPNINGNVYIIDLANSNRRSVYQLPMSTVFEHNNGSFKGTSRQGVTEQNLVEAWAWYLNETVSASGSIGGNTVSYQGYFRVNGDEDQLYFMFETSGLVQFNHYGSNATNIDFTLSNSRTVRLTAEIDSTTINLGNNAVSNSTAITGVDADVMLEVVRGDWFEWQQSGNTIHDYVASKTGTQINLSSQRTFAQNFTVTRKRLALKHIGWFKNSDYSLVNVPSSPPAFSAQYTNAESLTFAGSQTGTDFQPIVKFSHSSGGTQNGDFAKFLGDANELYFRADFDKMQEQSGTAGKGIGTVTASNWNVGSPGMYNANANVDYQYKVAFLRNIGSTQNPAYIESSASTDSNIVTLGSTADFIRVKGSSINSAVSAQEDKVDKIRIYRVGGLYASYGWLKDQDVPRDNSGNFTSFADIDDMAQRITSTTLTPLSLPAPPPKDSSNGLFLQFVTYVSGLFYGAYGAKLRISEFGSPHSWPELGEYDVDSNITGIVEYYGQALVWTANATYLARGSAYDDITVSKVPDRQGLPVAYKDTVVEYQNSVFWISNDGLCMFSNGSISVISMPNFETFPTISGARGGAKDGKLYFFGSSGEGVTCDLKMNPPVFGKITENVDLRVFYSQVDDKLYLKKTSGSGAYGEGTTKSVNYKSKGYDFGDTNEFKIFTRAEISYKGSGTVTFTFDGSTIDQRVLANSANEITRYHEFSQAVKARYVEVSVSGSIEISEIDVEGYSVKEYATRMRWESADVTYSGTVTLQARIDGIVKTLSHTTLTSGDVATTRVYFPSVTTGYIPHLKNTEATQIGDIIDVKYNTSDL